MEDNISQRDSKIEMPKINTDLSTTLLLKKDNSEKVF
jgi:hypothetical protein